MSGFQLVKGSSGNEVMLSFRHPTDQNQVVQTPLRGVLMQAMQALEAAEACYTKLVRNVWLHYLLLWLPPPEIELKVADREGVYDQAIMGWSEGNFKSKFAMPVGSASGTAVNAKFKGAVIRMVERVRAIGSSSPEVLRGLLEWDGLTLRNLNRVIKALEQTLKDCPTATWDQAQPHLEEAFLRVARPNLPLPTQLGIEYA